MSKDNKTQRSPGSIYLLELFFLHNERRFIILKILTILRSQIHYELFSGYSDLKEFL